VSKVFFVGCGPGDPDLITIKAKKLIQKADVVVYSGSLIPQPILKLCKKGKLHNAAKLVREEIFKLLKNNAKKGKVVVRLHDGDPTIYGAIKEQIDNLEKEGIKSEIIPGVTSFLASAAALGTQLTLPGVTQTIIVTRAEKRTKVPKREQISELAKHGATMIFYLSVHLLSDIVKQAIAGGYTKSVIIGDVVKPTSSEYSKLYDKTFCHGYRKKK
jgi:precorrin-4/cobalt-precorrin-4 C11-methyltransferase